MAGRRGSADKLAAENQALKMKVKELEDQVSDYKRRLDGLRKAKNTTILKREREIVQVGGPDLGRRDAGKIQELEAKLASSHEKQRELDELKNKHVQDLKALNLNKEASCNHEEEIKRLKVEVDDLTGDNAALFIENEDLKDRVASLIQELSVKEAKWCETEEKSKLHSQYGQKYQEWMAEMESKVSELQQTNTLLHSMLNSQRPLGSDPSGQDT